MLSEAFQGGEGNLRVEREPASPIMLAQKGDVFDGLPNKIEVVQMGDIPKIFFPEHEKQATV